MKTFFRLICTLVLLVALRASQAAAAEVWVDCTPQSVASYHNRVHIRCTASFAGGIQFFAVGTSDTAIAARFLSVATTALVAGRGVSILYDPDDKSGASFNCLVTDCRKAVAIEMH